MNDTVDVVMCPYCGDSWKKQQKCGDLYIKH